MLLLERLAVFFKRNQKLFFYLFVVFGIRCIWYLVHPGFGSSNELSSLATV